MSDHNRTLGFIGLGIMGKPMVRNLIAAGHTVHVYSRNAADIEQLVRHGATGQSSPAAVAREAEITFTMVPDTPHVLEAVLGSTGIIHSLCEGKVLVDMSTISSVATRQIAEAVEAAGARMLDAPVSGGEKGAIEGTLSISWSGKNAALQRGFLTSRRLC